MHHSLRSISALCCLGWVTLFGLHGCSGRLGPVHATQSAGSTGHANLPDITVERAKECVEFDGRQLEKGRVVLDATVDVNKDGDNVGVTVGGIPETARDFGICIRKVLEGMPIAKQPLRDAVETLEFHRKHAGHSPDALERFLELIPGVPIVESELVLEADGYTVVIPVTVKVRAKLEELIDIDEPTLKKIGQMAIDTLGYEEIMNRAEEQGWIKTVPDEQAQATLDKKFIGDVSLSPTPQPPVRPPPPPPPSIITKTVTQRVVVTRTAPPAVARVLPTALARAAPTAVLPGLGQMIAVGTVVVTLIEFGVLKPEDVLGAQVRSSTISGGAVGAAVGGAIGAAAAPITTTTTTPAPAPTTVKPRKYPNQTCEEDERERLGDEMNKLCKDPKGFAADCPAERERETMQKKGRKYDTPCSAVLLSIVQRQACLAARWEVQNKCFGGKPDGPHKDKIDQTQTGIDHCELLEPINCAKGHPMAEK